jgi:hypothetical protein
MNPRPLSSSSTLPLDVGGIMQWSPWGLAVVALLGLSGCLRADRGWVQEQLAMMQIQMAMMRDRVALVEQQFGPLDSKVDHILAQTEQLAARQMAPAEPPPDGRLLVETTFAAGTTALTPAAQQSIARSEMPRDGAGVASGYVPTVSGAARPAKGPAARNSNGVGPEPSRRQAPPDSVRWQSLEVSYHSPAGEPFVFRLPALARTPEGRPVDVTLEAPGEVPRWLLFDRERLHISGTAPLTAADQTYRLMIRAHTEQGSDSRVLVWLTITGPPNRITSTPRLPAHWRW